MYHLCINPQDRINTQVIHRFALAEVEFYLTIVNKHKVTVTLGWQDSTFKIVRKKIKLWC